MLTLYNRQQKTRPYNEINLMKSFGLGERKKVGFFKKVIRFFKGIFGK